MPVPECDVRASFVPDLVFVKEEAELGLGGHAAAFRSRVCEEIIVGRKAGPVPGVSYGNRSIQRSNLCTHSCVNTGHREGEKKRRTNLDLTILLDPTGGQIHPAVFFLPEVHEFAIRHGSPFGLEFPDLDDVSGTLVVPTEHMIRNVVRVLGQEVERLGVIMPHRELAGADGDSECRRRRDNIPLGGEKRPRWEGETWWGKCASASALDKHIQQSLRRKRRPLAVDTC